MTANSYTNKHESMSADGDVQEQSLMARSLFWFRLAALAIAIVVLGWGGSSLYQKYDVPVAVIGIDGGLQHVTRQEVEALVAANLGGGFLSLNLGGICQALAGHSWIATASARRKWPDEVIITIEEEVAIARWGNGRFLSNQGRVLNAGQVALPESLPLLQGPDGTERQVMQQYRNFSQVLQMTEMELVEFRLGPRGNWEAKFEPGLELIVGKDPVAEKLERFLLVWNKTLRSRLNHVEQVDLRYGNGIAVRWKKDTQTDA